MPVATPMSMIAPGVHPSAFNGASAPASVTLCWRSMPQRWRRAPRLSKPRAAYDTGPLRLSIRQASLTGLSPAAALAGA